MSVIGRLDDQVNRVLIAPLDKNSQPATDESVATHDEQATSPRSARHDAREENERSQDERPAPKELPIWLL